MKQIMKLLAAILLLSTLTISCSKDDKDDIAKTKNHFKVGDIEYELSAGFLDNVGTYDDHEGYRTDLTLVSKGIKSDEYDLLDGKGDYIYFRMFSTTGEAFDNKDYVFSSKKPTPIGAFNFGNYVINIDFIENTEDADVPFSEGKVSVSKKGDEYTIIINCISEKGEKVTGFYKGKLQYILLD